MGRLYFKLGVIIFVDMNALVIGATGAIGKDLVEQLLKDDTFAHQRGCDLVHSATTGSPG